MMTRAIHRQILIPETPSRAGLSECRNFVDTCRNHRVHSRLRLCDNRFGKYQCRDKLQEAGHSGFQVSNTPQNQRRQIRRIIERCAV